MKVDVIITIPPLAVNIFLSAVIFFYLYDSSPVQPRHFKSPLSLREKESFMGDGRRCLQIRSFLQEYQFREFHGQIWDLRLARGETGTPWPTATLEVR